MRGISAGRVEGECDMNPTDSPIPAKQTISNRFACEIDFIAILLFIGIVVFAGAMVLVDQVFKDDPQIFQVFAGLVTAFSGGFFTRIKSSPTPAQPQDKVKEGN